VILTLHRLRAAGLPLSLVVLFFVPIVNLLLFAVLSVLPTRELTVVAAGPRPLERAHRRLTGDSYWRSGLLSILVTVPLSVLGIVLGANVLESYGFSLFVGLPFALGMISVILFGFSRPKPLGWCLLVAACATFFAGFVVVLVALEGVICLIMAAPIAMGLALIGALIGYAIQARPWLNSWTAHAAGADGRGIGERAEPGTPRGVHRRRGRCPAGSGVAIRHRLPAARRAGRLVLPNRRRLPTTGGD
jgi:hypothetical protein